MVTVALIVCGAGWAADAGSTVLEPDWLALARTRGEAGFYAARDASARMALDGAHDDDARLAALKLLADTAERTGDWTVLDTAIFWPPPPSSACGCDSLALHAAVLFRRRGRTGDALRWLDAVSPGSPEWAEAELMRAEADLVRPKWGVPGGSLKRGIEALESVVRGNAGGDAHARVVAERATLELARLRCTPGTYTEATALLDTLAGVEARTTDVALARAWCAVDAGRPTDLAALLPTLDATERKGAWLPSLPLLHALARTADDPNARRRGLEAVVAGNAPLWRQLEGTAVALAAAADSPKVWKLLLKPKSGLPEGLVAQIRSSELVAGLTGRFLALDREDRLATDPAVRAELEAERVAASRRAALALSSLVGAYAGDVGGLSHHAQRLLADLDAQPDPTATAGERTLGAAQGLRAIERQMGDVGPDTRGEIAARIAYLELGWVPTASSVETLRRALAPAWEDGRRESVAWTLALTLIDAGRVAEAEATLRELSASSPRGPKGWQAEALLGDLAFARKEFDRAGGAYTAAMAAPDKPLALYAAYRLAWCAWATDRPAVAVATLAKVIADPDTPPALRASAQAERQLLGTCRKGMRCGR